MRADVGGQGDARELAHWRFDGDGFGLSWLGEAGIQGGFVVDHDGERCAGGASVRSGERGRDGVDAADEDVFLFAVWRGDGSIWGDVDDRCRAVIGVQIAWESFMKYLCLGYHDETWAAM